MELANSVTLVTGRAGGLGEAVVRRITAAGGSVIIVDLADEKAAKLAEDACEATAVYVRTDVTDEASVQNAVDEAKVLVTFRHVVIAHGGFDVVEKVVQRDGLPANLAGLARPSTCT